MAFRYFVESYGCTLNQGEGDQLSESMSKLGHVKVDSADDAEIVVLNTCTVVETTEKAMIQRIVDLKGIGKEVIVTGCMAKAQPNRIRVRLPDSLIIHPLEYDSFEERVESRYGFSQSQESDIGNILPISQGCMGSCTYCITKFARGHLRSRTIEELTERFERIVGSGVGEVLVTSQDAACYGKDIGTDLPSLLGSMLKVKGGYRIRIGMMNPNALNGILDGLLDAMEDDRVYKFLHIPVQSGSNEVLKGMGRGYTKEEFLSIISRIRGRFPDMSISTDVIVGFPGESDDDHRMTLDLLRTLKADTVNITRFSPRPGTEASMMEMVHGRTVKERSGEITKVRNKIELDVNMEDIGRTFKVVVTEGGKDGTMIGRTSNYRPVAIATDSPLWSVLDVEIIDCKFSHLIGRVLNTRK